MTTTKVYDCISLTTGEVVTLSVPVGYTLPQVMELAGITDPCDIRRMW